MTNTQILCTIFEGFMIILLIFGFIFEDKLIAFEDKLIRRMKAKRHKANKSKITSESLAAEGNGGSVLLGTSGN